MFLRPDGVCVCPRARWLRTHCVCGAYAMIHPGGWLAAALGCGGGGDAAQVMVLEAVGAVDQPVAHSGGHGVAEDLTPAIQGWHVSVSVDRGWCMEFSVLPRFWGF